MPTTQSRPSEPAPTLRRTLSLPSLVLYGLGVTIGAGIFALVGEIVDTAGTQAPLSFVLAAVLASFTAVSYMALVRDYPAAGGEAVYVKAGLGPTAARLVGLGVAATGIISSAVVALAFAGYLKELIDLPERLTAVLLVLVLSLVAWRGVRESVMLAVTVTLFELGTLVVVVLFGADLLTAPGLIQDAFTPSLSSATTGSVLTGAVIAFFAFIGFEDIVNMAEETVDPRRVAPRAIAIVLVVSISLYVLLALIAVGAPDREALTGSSAPMAELFQQVSGRDGSVVAAIASVAMINGILAQVLVASRILLGMGREGLLPTWIAKLDRTRRTPARATATVAALITVLVVGFPLVQLARLTSLLTLFVFTAVNTALFALARTGTHPHLTPFRWVGFTGALLSGALGVWQVGALVT